MVNLLTKEKRMPIWFRWFQDVMQYSLPYSAVFTKLKKRDLWLILLDHATRKILRFMSWIRKGHDSQSSRQGTICFWAGADTKLFLLRISPFLSARKVNTLIMAVLKVNLAYQFDLCGLAGNFLEANLISWSISFKTKCHSFRILIALSFWHMIIILLLGGL